jgi:hypothetical protein
MIAPYYWGRGRVVMILKKYANVVFGGFLYKNRGGIKDDKT